MLGEGDLRERGREDGPVNYLEDHWQAIRTVYLEDNGGAGKDRLGLDSGRYADDCSPAPGPEYLPVTLDTGRVTISGG